MSAILSCLVSLVVTAIEVVQPFPYWKNEPVPDSSQLQMDDLARGELPDEFIKRFFNVQESVRDIRMRTPSEHLSPTECTPGQLLSASAEVASLEYLLEDIQNEINAGVGDSPIPSVIGKLEEAEGLAEALSADQEPLKERRGLFQRAYRSELDNTLQPYCVFVPKEYQGQAMPLLIGLHGMYGDHWQIPELLRLRENPDRMPYLVVCPRSRMNSGYRGQAEVDFWQMLRTVKKRYNVDEDRIYLTGIAMGAYGAFHLALTRPDVFAAVAPIGGGADLDLAQNALHIPFFLAHSALDEIVPVECSRTVSEDFAAFGVSHVLRMHEAPRRELWNRIYGRGELVSWLEDKVRERAPTRVVFQTKSLRHNRAYWIRIDRLERYDRLARIEANVQEDGIVSVNSVNVTAFSILTAQSPILSSTQTTVIWNGRRFSADLPQEIISMDSGHGSEHQKAGKMHGISGPCWDIFYSRVLCVFGTQADSESANDILRREAVAMARFGRMDGDWLPCKADSDVNPVDLADYNLILFGTSESNSVVARLISHIPVELSANRVTIGQSVYEGGNLVVQMIFPNPLNTRRYAMVVAGTGPEAVAGYHKLNLAQSGADLVLFNKTAIDEGKGDKEASVDTLVLMNFDSSWHIPSPLKR